MKKIILVTLLTAITVLSANAGDADFKIIVNSAISASNISTGDLKKIFLQKMKKFSGQTAVIVNLKKGNSTREAFSKKILGKSAKKIDRLYLKNTLSGKGAEPDSVKSDQDVVAFVKSTKGALGYVSSSAKADGVKEISMK